MKTPTLILVAALGDEEGVPYEGAFDAARRIYEGRVASVPPEERGEPFRHIQGAAVRLIFNMRGIMSLPGEELTRAELSARGLRHVEEALRDLPGDAALFERACGVGGVRSSN